MTDAIPATPATEAAPPPPPIAEAEAAETTPLDAAASALEDLDVATAEADTTPEAEAEVAQPETETEAKPIGDVEQAKGSRSWTHAMIKRRQRQNDRREAALEARETVVSENEASKRELDELAMMLRANPIAAAEALAKRAGFTSEDFLERLQAHHLNDGMPTEHQTLDAMTSMRKEIAQLRDDLASERTEKSNRTSADQLRESITADVAAVAAMPTSTPGKWTHLDRLAASDPGYLNATLHEAVEWLTANRPGEVDPAELLDHLDEREALAYSRYSRTSESSPAADQGTAEPEKKPASPRMPSQSDAATGGNGREMTEQEVLLQVDKLLFGG